MGVCCAGCDCVGPWSPSRAVAARWWRHAPPNSTPRAWVEFASLLHPVPAHPLPPRALAVVSGARVVRVAAATPASRTAIRKSPRPTRGSSRVPSRKFSPTTAGVATRTRRCLGLRFRSIPSSRRKLFTPPRPFSRGSSRPSNLNLCRFLRRPSRRTRSRLCPIGPATAHRREPRTTSVRNRSAMARCRASAPAVARRGASAHAVPRVPCFLGGCLYRSGRA